MGFIIVSMLVIVVVAVLVVTFVAFPHRGEEVPGAPWLTLRRPGYFELPLMPEMNPLYNCGPSFPVSPSMQLLYGGNCFELSSL